MGLVGDEKPITPAVLQEVFELLERKEISRATARLIFTFCVDCWMREHPSARIVDGRLVE